MTPSDIESLPRLALDNARLINPRNAWLLSAPIPSPGDHPEAFAAACNTMDVLSAELMTRGAVVFCPRLSAARAIASGAYRLDFTYNRLYFTAWCAGNVVGVLIPEFPGFAQNPITIEEAKYASAARLRCFRLELPQFMVPPNAPAA